MSVTNITQTERKTPKIHMQKKNIKGYRITFTKAQGGGRTGLLTQRTL